MASSKKAIYAAIAGNFAIAVTKFIGSAISGSSAMLTEGIHSLVDTGNGGLLLLGIRRSQQPADEAHPYGYGKALYFYALIVAILIFGLGGGISLYEGIRHALHAPAHVEATSSTVFGVTISGLMLNSIVLVAAIVFEGFAFRTAWQEFASYKGDQHWWTAIQTSKDPTIFTVLFEDSAAMAGLVVALIGVHLAHAFDAPVIDGIASIIIGLILCAVASVLVWESKGLLLGERADPALERSVRRLAAEDDAVKGVARLLTMQLGPHSVLLTLDLNFRRDLSAEGVEQAIDRLEAAIRDAHKEVSHIFVEAESLRRRHVDPASTEKREAAVSDTLTDTETPIPGVPATTTTTTRESPPARDDGAPTEATTEEETEARG
jgi:cation diffusion facilitator family transporter